MTGGGGVRALVIPGLTRDLGQGPAHLQSGRGVAVARREVSPQEYTTVPDQVRDDAGWDVRALVIPGLTRDRGQGPAHL